jgi:Tfp pilus assembly protein PilP
MRSYLVMLALLVGACGEDDPPPAAPKPPTAPGAPKGTPAKKGGPVKELKPMRRIEDRVACPTPSDAKKCDAKAPVCPASQYCLAAGDLYYCGLCPERDAIRHVFKPRDFQGSDIRDPFQSFIIQQPGLNVSADPTAPRETTQKCTRPDQFVFATRNYQALKLIGIVSQGTQRKALMADSFQGRVVKKGDCVGREKAFVKEIGAGYITFTVEAVGKTDASELSMQLYPTSVSLSDPDVLDPGAASSTTPTVAPPNAVPSPTLVPPASETVPGTTTTIIQDRPGTTTTTVPSPTPQQAPTQLKP